MVLLKNLTSFFALSLINGTCKVGNPPPPFPPVPTQVLFEEPSERYMTFTSE